MSEKTALTELASFLGRSPVAAEDLAARNRVLAGMTNRLLGKKRSVGDLLGIVLVLSARARRVAQPSVNIDIDVFAPGGKRAVRMSFGRR